MKFFRYTRPFFYVLGTTLLLWGAVSCRKYLSVDPPINQLTSQTVFSSDQTATAALTGLYGKMMISLMSWSNGGLSVYSGLSADEFLPTAPEEERDQFAANALQASNSIVQSQFWGAAYSHVYHANAIIEGLNRSTGVSTGVKRVLMGEAKLARALCYYYLVNLFGDVPLVTTTSYSESATMGRTPVARVYEQMVADLSEARDLLSESDATGGRTRPNKWTAAALLARVYLYGKDWQGAESAAASVLSAGLYQLESDVPKVFLPGSRETIWQLAPVISSFQTTEGFAFLPYPATALPPYRLSDRLLDAFDSSDLRSAAWLGSSTVNGQTYYFPAKYHIKFAFLSTGKENNVVLRLAEQYLIRAEARAGLNKLPEALEDLNTIRRRAGLGDTAVQDQAELLRALEEERQRELAFEWGHRWLDLKRTGRINDVLAPVKAGWQPTDALYPIPLSELQTNPALTQNEGY